jgi:hypothetical protein
MQSVTKRVVLFLVITLSVAGCDIVTDVGSKVSKGGSLKNYDACIAKSTSLSKRTTKRYCKKKHSRVINITTSGLAGYQIFASGRAFTGSITNESEKYILTGITINIKHKDNKDGEGKHITETCKVEDLWIEPKRSGRFECIPLKFNPRDDRLDNDKEKLWDWRRSETVGIRIDL